MNQQTARAARGRSRAMRRRRATRVVAWCLATLLVAAWLWAPQASGTEADDTPYVEDALPIPSGFTVAQLAVDSPAGLIYEIGDIAGKDGEYVQVVSATRRQLVGSPVALTADGAPAKLFGGNAVVDEAQHRLFLPVGWANSGGFRATGVLVFDGPRRAVTNAEAPLVPYVNGQTLQIDLAQYASLSYDADSDRLFVIGFPTAAPSAGGASVQGNTGLATPPASVVQIDPSTGGAESYSVAGCLQLPQTLGGVPIVWEDALWLFCGGSTLLNASAPNFTQGAFRIQLADGHFPAAGSGVTIFPVAGYYGGLGFQGADAKVVGDPAGGRILVVAPSPGPAQIFVFDLPTRRVVGLMGIDAAAIPQHGCLDADGRFFLESTTTSPVQGSQLWGFLRGEARATSSPYPQVAGYPEFLTTGFHSFHFACDWVRRQVLVGLMTGENKPAVLVVRDPKPPYEPPPAPLDPDAATTGGPYDPATSGLAYQGDGRGFGAQVRLVGGYDPLVSTFVQSNNPSNLALGPAGSIGSIISPNSPKLTLGAAGLPDSPQGVVLSDSQATSAAQGIARDGGLEADMGRAGPALSEGGASDNGDDGESQSGGAPDPWLYPITSCAASPGEKPMTRGDTGASVTCDPEHNRSAASADASEPVEIPGLVRIVGAGSSVISEVDKETGVLTTITKAWAKAVSLADGEIEIDDAVAEAVAQAGGQPGSAKAIYRRSVGQLLIDGQVVCAPCDPVQVADAINAHPFTQPTLRASVPMPEGASAGSDSQLYEIPGTPGGAQAEVARAADTQLEDQAINEQSPYDHEVGALRLELSNDSLRHLNLVIDLAAPQAFSRLQILAADTAVEETTTTTAPAELLPTLPPSPVADEPPAPVADVVPEPAGPPPAAPGFALVSYTPPAPPSAPDVITSQPRIEAPLPPPVLPGPLGHIESGLRAAFSSPSKFIALFLVWAVMAIPVYLASRRRLVVDFILGTTEGLS